MSRPTLAASALDGATRAGPGKAPTVGPQGCTNLKLRQLTRRVTQHYDVELAKAGLKTTQYSLLSHLVKLGPIRPGELAREMTLDASTLTRNLKPLLDAGWAELAPGSDNRSRSVTITDLGRRKQAEGRHHWLVAQRGLNALLGAQRVADLHALLDETLDRLTEPTAGASDD